MDTTHYTSGSALPSEPLDGVLVLGAQRQGQAAPAGAPPSNTAHANYIAGHIPPALVLRNGVDSLYLSFWGRIAETRNELLSGLELLAKSDDPDDQAKAQGAFGEHVFEAPHKGQVQFAYVLADNWYRIAIRSRRSAYLPLALVQISSELLAGAGVDQAVKEPRFIIGTLGIVYGEPTISRVDLFVDFVTSVRLGQWGSECWITRAKNIDKHYDRKRFSGWTIGKSGSLNVNLYNKTIEMEQKPREYLKPLWIEAGWDGSQDVWRLEFKYKRDVLRELSVTDFPDLIPKLEGLWRYGTEKWLRLTEPTGDTNQNRWPTHPLWSQFTGIAWRGSKGNCLFRVKKSRVPSDKFFFENAMGGFTSFMAAKGIAYFAEGFGEYLAQAEEGHRLRPKDSPRALEKYVDEKVAKKDRHYNNLLNAETDPAEIRAAAVKYRQAQDGE